MHTPSNSRKISAAMKLLFAFFVAEIHIYSSSSKNSTAFKNKIQLLKQTASKTF
jgi:hypothetical protein